MPTSFSCQRSSFRSTVSDRNVSAPGGARIQFGAEPAKQTRNQIKNPATSAGRIRPSLWASFPRALGRMCSKLVFLLSGVRNQPHLWMSRQARSVSRLPRESGLHQPQRSIAKSKFPSSCIQDFFTSPSQSPCEFHRKLWKRLPEPCSSHRADASAAGTHGALNSPVKLAQDRRNTVLAYTRPKPRSWVGGPTQRSAAARGGRELR